MKFMLILYNHIAYKNLKITLKERLLTVHISMLLPKNRVLNIVQA